MNGIKKYKENLSGKTFGRLTVINFCYKDKQHEKWLCKCICGEETIKRRDHLFSGRSISCGCFRKGKTIERKRIHGMTGSRFYKIWSGMKQRCCNENSPKYGRYGGRGITVCDRWLSFEKFKEDMYEDYQRHANKFGEYNTTIDRINNNGTYCFENTRWATWSEQAENRGRLIKYNGKIHNIAIWAKKFKINKKTLTRRMDSGLSIEEAIHVPFLK